MKHFRFWCSKVLPLVYDDSLSYYEVLCKVVHYINDLINSDREIIGDIDGLRSDLLIVQEWIDKFDISNISKLISENIATMIFVEIDEAGYIVYNIPDGWEHIFFTTTGLDTTAEGYDYGHLVLSY